MHDKITFRLGQFNDNSDENAEFVLPEDLSALSDEDLAGLESQALDAFDAIRNGGPLSDEDLTNLQALADAATAIRNEAGRRFEVAGAAEEQAAGLDSIMHPAGSDAAEGEDDAENDGGNDGDDEERGEDDGENADAGDEESANTPEPVTAGGAPTRGPIRVPLAAVTRRAPRPNVEDSNSGRVSITAAADISGIPVGADLDFDRLAVAFGARAAAMGDSRGRNTKAPVATISKPAPGDTIRSTSSLEEVDRIIREATQPQTLVASGGWCAPSAPIFDMFNIADTAGLIDLPTVNIDRGGIKVPVSPSIQSVVGDTWAWTEANDIASSPGGSPTKPCFHIPCTTWNDARLQAEGICVIAGNLADRAFPEMTKNTIALVTAQHEHVMSADAIMAMAAGSVAVTMPNNTASGNAAGALAPLLNAVELQGFDYRYKYKMAPTAQLEIVLPFWVRGVWRADLGYRFGADADDFAIPDALLDSYFAARHISPQYVQDWQAVGAPNIAGSALIADGALQVGRSAATPTLGYPTTVGFLLYAAGTWVKGTGGTLDLGVIRDSVLNATNDFTAAWTEDFWLIFQKGHESRRVTVPLGNPGAVASTMTVTAI